ncbi:Glycoprotease family protein [Candidatus Phytoplasma pruni]|uniref:Glycoprotease family protein n=1 Tax=Candidatus Phytoplasma pruni TaxID=479893 RepID=A0A0M1MZW9_9MOLU|nr:tRNA (adenosine(37)-N6)-threonylcarbamoyltransferase complex dimerization subunit type 1 TsaB [Candidatus Phytoplasma pruni]KOR75446.1 Glycoprotease family protein [Candidatus Phytoplasma pruni]MCQ9618447.1 tRNA (adenosine(37)-N6)-threonylcarbamoyltransferase complex dimerization subunit type 1 TsaB [Candidatus Phytoplasma pruni]MDW3618014.1 tRNA (adenosine(37)-N6)-threonylcarbamoyltransferase complex dimerization subunit type 1 TsaB [Candidatus Phytoplasma pruni]
MNHNQMKKYIILDTSAAFQLVTLIDDEKIISIQKNTKSRTFVENMIPLIDIVLKESNISLKELNGIIVGVGPGSFTGIKVAVLTAKMLASELSIPLYRISSLLLLSSGYSDVLLTPKVAINENSFYSLSLANNKVILPEKNYSSTFLKDFPNHLLITEKTFRLSPVQVFFYMQKVTEPHHLVPNYCIPYLNETMKERSNE